MQKKRESVVDISFSELFDLDDIQHIQDLFADATGVASIITHPDGTPITRPSNFCRLCNEIIRKTDLGLSNCFKSDAEIGKPIPSGPVIQPCLSGGLWDAGASIIVGGKHIANWLIGQVKNDGIDSARMLHYANEIGADQKDFMKALDEVPVMPKERFEKIAQMLFAFASEISSKAYQNSQLIQSVLERKHDITKSKLAEEELMKSEIINRTLIKHLPQRIFIKDPDSKYILCNDIYSRDLGINPKEIVGKDDFAFFSSELAEKYRSDDQQVISEGIQKEFEEKYSISNKERWTHVIKVPYRDVNDQIVGVLGIFEDITDRKLAEEEIQLKNELLQTINAEKDKFFSILAHDLKGPLSSFLGATQILTEEIQYMTLEEIREVTVSMKESASSIYGLLENLLEWSRLKRGRMEFCPEKINVKQKTISCIEILKESARKKEIRLNYSLADDLEVYADTHMFETIIRNLVSNAIKFTPKSGEIYISATNKPNNTTEIVIRDTGIGMKKELISKLFLLNEKTNREGTDGEPSTGLGLLLCKEFIDKNCSKIRVESEEGKGSTFTLIIPESTKEMIKIQD